VESCVLYVDVAIKSYAISSLTGSTFDGFIDCTLDRLTVSTCNFTILQQWSTYPHSVQYLSSAINFLENPHSMLLRLVFQPLDKANGFLIITQLDLGVDSSELRNQLDGSFSILIKRFSSKPS